MSKRGYMILFPFDKIQKTLKINLLKVLISLKHLQEPYGLSTESTGEALLGWM